MKTNSISAAVLLTLFVNFLLSCSLKPDDNKEAVNHTLYVKQLVENHKDVRSRIQDFADKIPLLRDTSSFTDQLFPFMMKVDSLMFMRQNQIEPTDSFIMSLSDRLYSDYGYIVHLHFKHLFEVYNQAGDRLNDVEQAKIDSIWSVITYNDSASLNMFMKYVPIDSSAKTTLNYFHQ